MTSTISRLADLTIEITISIPWSEISQVYDQVVEKATKSAQVPGFRQGKAPKKMVEGKLDTTKIYEDVIRQIIPKVYQAALAEHKLHPVIVPKIEIKEAKEKSDWVIQALTCEKPLIELADFKKAIQELKASKKNKIWVPGQDLPAGRQEPKVEGEKEKQKLPTLDEILHALFDNVKTTLSHLLIDHEVNRLLSELIDQTKKLGLTVEQYMASTNRTSDSIKQEYENQAKHTLVLEFTLEEIADKEGLFVSDDDINNVIKNAKTDDERKAMESQRYYLANILRRQKTLDFLCAL